ncbi:MAG: EamA family transporter [Candidatus Methanomethylicia archaeon]
MLEIILASIIWGSIGIAGKIAYGLGVDPLTLILYRTLLIIPLAIYIARGITSFKAMIKLFILGIFIIPFFYLTYFYAVKIIEASTASLLLYIAPILVNIISRIVFNEKLTKPKIYALLLAITGVIVLNYGDINFNPIGLILGLASAFNYAIFIIISKYMLSKGITPEQIAIVPPAFSSVTVFIVSLIGGVNLLNITPSILIISIYLSYVATGFAYYLFNNGLKHVEASRASIGILVEPVSAVILSSIILYEPLTIQKILGGGIILTAVYITSKNR